MEETKNMCQGFRAAGISARIKKKNAKDLGLIVSDVPATAAGVFTKNKIKAAPVLLDMERLAAGTCQAVIVNSGNANCCTGAQGMADARQMGKTAADNLGVAEDAVLVSSTGVIGQYLPVDKVEAAIPALLDALSADGFSWILPKPS